MCKCEGDLSHSGRLLLLRLLRNSAFFFSPAAPNDKDKSSWISHCESSGQIAHIVERLAQSPKGLWFRTRQKQCVLKPATLMITFKSIRRGSVAQWDNLQIYTCGLLMLCKLFQLLTAQILFEIWCVIRVSRPKDEVVMSFPESRTDSSECWGAGWSCSWFDCCWLNVFESDNHKTHLVKW